MAIPIGSGENINRATGILVTTGPLDGRVVGVDNSVIVGIFTGVGEQRNVGQGEVVN